jgi:high-affinity nickel-transport protein
VTVTTVSILVALVIGSIEVLGLVAQWMNQNSGIWRAIAALNGNFSTLGFATIGIFAASWIVSFSIYRWRGIGRHEAESA